MRSHLRLALIGLLLYTGAAGMIRGTEGHSRDPPEILFQAPIENLSAQALMSEIGPMPTDAELREMIRARESSCPIRVVPPVSYHGIIESAVHDDRQRITWKSGNIRKVRQYRT